MSEKSVEQEARDMMERAGDEHAQSRTSGDVVEIANVIAELKRLRRHVGHTEGKSVVWLPFSAYELANIAEMFKAITPYRFRLLEERSNREGNPLCVMDSGDWCGVLADRFVAAKEKFAPAQNPNRSWTDYQGDAKAREEAYNIHLSWAAEFTEERWRRQSHSLTD